MEKIRVTLHNGRKGYSSHNDRSALNNLSEFEKRKIAPHIIFEKSKENYYWSISSFEKDLSKNKKSNFKQDELNYYNKHFSKALNVTNQNYINNGHPERVKTIEDWYKSSHKKPVESIIQIGDQDANIDPATFKKAAIQYVNTLMKNYGNNVKILNVAIHLDEASPHAHIRHVFTYNDKGITKIGQNKALEQLGINLPNPEEKTSRFNNRKITFDKILRQKWQEIAKSYGFNIETEPRVGYKHKEKEDFINSKLAEKEERLNLFNDMVNTIDKYTQYEPWNEPNKIKSLFGLKVIPSASLNKLKTQNKTYLESTNFLKAENKKLKKYEQMYFHDRNGERIKMIHYARKEHNSLINDAKEKAKALNQDLQRELDSQREYSQRLYDDILERANIDISTFNELKKFKKEIDKIEKNFPEEFQELKEKTLKLEQEKDDRF